jgi:3-hydroxyisobutyrate dehydrogenase-like beta-hydroxyacid dehydrogenase
VFQDLFRPGPVKGIIPKSKTDGLVKNGAKWAASPGEVAKGSDVFFTMLPYPEDIRKAAEGANGFLEHITPGTLWVDFSTVSPWNFLFHPSPRRWRKRH